jgi:hypothetical protein
MGNNDINKTENILIKVDDNNIVYIDPNSVLNNKVVEQRDVPAENLVVYVNLEADLIPRTVLAIDSDSGKASTPTNIASGKINFLKNSVGKDFDTTWTEAFLTPQETINAKGKGTGLFTEYDASAQTFGIDSINMSIKGYTVPNVTINFTDVRGKTLFESPANSPYKTFFHMPWPIFYLTLKGYYGKAIRYRLHLTKFISKYNEANGNFDITCTFIGSTYAFLADIPLVAALNAPFMFGNESISTDKNNVTTKTITVSRSSKGYSLLNTIYEEYKAKNLIDKNFPVKTLREVVILAKSIDEILERQIFTNSVKPQIFSALEEFGGRISNFKLAIQGYRDSKTKNEIRTDIKGNDEYRKLADSEKNSDKSIFGQQQDSLESLLKNNVELLKKTQALTQNLSDATFSSQGFKKQIFSYINNTGNVDDYVYLDNLTGTYWIAINSLISKIDQIENSYQAQKEKFEQRIEDLMNSVVKNQVLGFDPTIRNIFAVICANAEVYIRLMKDVHTRAFEVGKERKEIIKNWSSETPNGDNIYPWPQIEKLSRKKAEKEIVYPGDKTVRDKIQSYNSRLWPEVEFVEEYEKVASKKTDNLANKESGVNAINFVFEDNSDSKLTKPISPLLTLGTSTPYYDKTLSSIVYEIYERGVASIFYDFLDDSYGGIVQELSTMEFNNIQNVFNEDYSISNTLRTITGFSRTNGSSDRNNQSLETLLLAYSPNERYPYYKEKLYTNEYIKSAEQTPFKIEQNVSDSILTDSTTDYVKYRDFIKKYSSPNFRKNTYPFNSPTYLGYLDKTSVPQSELNLSGFFDIDTSSGFITQKEPVGWTEPYYQFNLFDKKLVVGSSETSILNTPLFHNQLLYDFVHNKSYGKYRGSAYLLLNSLGFKDLQDLVTIKGISQRMSSVLKELGATHYIPYHLMLKWGSLYHRYKKYINDGVDILEGGLNSSNKILGLDLNMMFDGSTTGKTYTVDGKTLSRASNNSVGFNPFYQNVFHQIVNGYTFFDMNTPITYEANRSLNQIYTRYVDAKTAGVTYWTSFVDNSTYDDTANYYTVLPSCYPQNDNNLGSFGNINDNQQSGFKIIINDETVTDKLTGNTFPSFSQYNVSFDSTKPRTKDGLYSLTGVYREIIDLIGTFSPEILSAFEVYFLEFASEIGNTEIPDKLFTDKVITINNVTKTHVVEYQKFQELLAEIVNVPKESGDTKTYLFIQEKLHPRQQDVLRSMTKKMLSTDNLIKLTLGNPKEYNLSAFSKYALPTLDNPFNYKEFNASQLTPENLGYINLYCGHDIDGKYLRFFQISNIELNEENVLELRSLILMYAGYVQAGGEDNYNSFTAYIRENIIVGYNARFNSYFVNLFSLLTKIKHQEFDKRITINSGYNTDSLKLQVYDFFKLFNDKWTSGNSIGQRSLLEEFLFIDKANQDIGNRAYISIEKLAGFDDATSDRTTLFAALADMLTGTGFDLRGMPAYINFYTNDFKSGAKITPSKKIAKDIFGTFLEVDYQESTPKILIQYVNTTSKHTNVSSELSKDKYLYNDDGVNIFDSTNNPLRVTIPEVFDPAVLYNSNRVVGFEVNVGDQNQAIFKGVQLTQESLKNTAEFFKVLEEMSRSETGASTYSMDQNLFDLGRNRSYTCEVTMMGNVMIQPTMYFYLKNVPLFRGTYLITDVSHEIRPNTILTKFSGTRLNKAALPDPSDSFMAGYKTLFQKLMNKAKAKQETTAQATATTTTQTVQTKDNKGATFDIGTSKVKINGEEQINESGIDKKFGVAYNSFNGEKYITAVKINKVTYYKTRVAVMGGTNYQIGNSVEMSLLNQVPNIIPTNQSAAVITNTKIKWEDAVKYTDTNLFYSVRFNLNDVPSLKKQEVATNIFTAQTEFLVPNKAGYIIQTVSPMTIDINNRVVTPNMLQGAINIGPKEGVEYGVGLSNKLMKELKLKDGDVVYFRLI